MRSKIVFRYFFATLIFLVSAILMWTTLVKSYEAWTAPKVQPQLTHLESTLNNKEFRLVSNNQKPDQKIFITVPNQGYIFTVSCEHYLNTLCKDQDNQHYFRLIKSLDLVHYQSHHYIQKIRYQNTQTLQNAEFAFTSQQINMFYAHDIKNMRYQLILLWFFSLFALYVSMRILRNFQAFLNK